ncbi:MAG: cation:dicarboxylate symporter family transporter, partial [Mycoplasmatales bacterium]
VDEAVAKIVSVSSLNMPGSVISNIIFAYGVITMYGLNISTMQMMVYGVVLIFATMIAPSIPGGVFSVTSSLLTPILGFNADHIGLMGALYYKQGTSNSATNNAADIYLGPLMDSNTKIWYNIFMKWSKNEKFNYTLRNWTRCRRRENLRSLF